MIHVKDKELVVPGQILAEEGYYSGRGTFKEGSGVCSSLMGLVSLRNKKISVIPLKSKYVPKKGDVVIGEIDDVRFSMWGVDVNSPYSGILPASEVFGREKKELSKVFNVGDVLFLRVVDVDEVKKVKLGLKGRGMGKFRGGILVDITPTKVPRLIGKKGSMINMIKDKTKCKIVVGQNGLVWVKGEKKMEQITKNIINLIEAEAHTSGLTNRIRDKLYLLVDGKLPEQEEEFEISSDDLESIDDTEKINDRVNNDKNNNDKSADVDISDSDNEEADVLEKPRLENIKEEIEAEINGSEDDNISKKQKTSYLDTFNHLKAQNTSKNSGLGEIDQDNNSSPILNISNSSNSSENKNNKLKPVTTWKRKS
ncbi:exosome complex protein Rrp4 [Methanobrevibacter sp. TMH8]|nr:exosome complex protein Rrp4 [Methanobrevibacter sp. TMH8]